MVCIEKSLGLLQKEKEKPEEQSPRWEGTYSRQSSMKGALQEQKTDTCHRSRKKPLHTGGCHVHSDIRAPLSVQLVGRDSIFVTAFVGKWVEGDKSSFHPCCSKLRRVEDMGFLQELFTEVGGCLCSCASILKTTMNSQSLKISKKKKRGKTKVEDIFNSTCRPLSEPLLLGFILELFSVILSNIFSHFYCYLKLKFPCFLESDCRSAQQTVTVTTFVIELPECQKQFDRTFQVFFPSKVVHSRNNFHVAQDTLP